MGTVHRSEGDGITTITLDDGKLNALDTEVFGQLDEAFDASGDARAIVLTGREGVFTAGLNTKKLPDMSTDALGDLMRAMGRTLMRIWMEPRPVVCAATGHAIAAGTMLAMACDHTVAASGEYKWGLSETQIGFALPEFAIALTRANVRSDRVDDLLLPGEIVGPDIAAEVGFVDEVVQVTDVLPTATARARVLADLPQHAYRATKRRLRAETAEGVLDRLEDDTRDMLSQRP